MATYWIGSKTSLEFEEPLSDEVARIIRDANPGYMGVRHLCAQLAQMGVPKPIGIRTSQNVLERETSLNVDNYWPRRRKGER